MDQYKCPICGNNEYVEADILSTGVGCEETVFEKKYGNLYERKVYHSFPARGLVNYSCSVSASDGISTTVNLVFNNNCSTKICTKCGFVSLHALAVAEGIIQDTALLKQKEEDLLKERESIVSEIESLKAELGSLPKKEVEISEQIQDENITIKKQKELQTELEGIKQHIKFRLPSLIKDKQQDLEINNKQRCFLSDCGKYISGHKITE